MDFYVIPKRIRSRIGKPGLSVILGVTKSTIERNILEPMRNIWGSDLVGEIHKEENFCPHIDYFYCENLCGFRNSCDYKTMGSE